MNKQENKLEELNEKLEAISPILPPKKAPKQFEHPPKLTEKVTIRMKMTRKKNGIKGEAQ